MAQRCSFISYGAVGELADNPLLEHMNDSVLEQFETLSEQITEF